jgi:FkbM family methyltransferase
MTHETLEIRRNLLQLLLDGFANKVMLSLRSRARRNGDFSGIVVPVDDLIGARVMATGRWELTTLDAIRGLLASPPKFVQRGRVMKFGTFIDVGANIGLYSIALSKYFDRTIAFEANPVTFKVLEANLALSGTRNANAVCVGVSSEPRKANLYTPGDGNLGWATLSAERHEGSAGVAEITIDLDTLDNLSQRLGFGDKPVSVIKVDVEGHEAEVLRGAVGLLDQWWPIVLFEVLEGAAGRESLDILRRCGYSDYWTFRRDLTLTSFVRGLPIRVDAFDVSNPRPAALVCAVKREKV